MSKATDTARREVTPDEDRKRNLLIRVSERLRTSDGLTYDEDDVDARSAAFSDAIGRALLAWNRGRESGHALSAAHRAELESYVAWSRNRIDGKDEIADAIEMLLTDLGPPEGSDAAHRRPSERDLIAEARNQLSSGLDLTISVAASSALCSEELAALGISPASHGEAIRRAHATATSCARSLVDLLKRQAVDVLDGYEAALGRIAELEAELARLRGAAASEEVS